MFVSKISRKKSKLGFASSKYDLLKSKVSKTLKLNRTCVGLDSDLYP